MHGIARASPCRLLEGETLDSVGFTGATGNPLPWYRQALSGAIIRRNFLAFGAMAVLIVVLLAVPEIDTATSVPAGTGIHYLAGQTPMNAPYSSGTTVGGVKCGPGVRQVPWSSYAPPCQPAWHGNNGGATSPGVTATTITLSYREAATSLLPLLYSVIPASVVGTNTQVIQTLQSYINIFNKTFELYGRQVKLAPYEGQGNFIDEDTGSGAAQAQADAVNVATSIKAFADMSLIDSSVVYTDDLQAQKVIAFGLYLESRQWYEAGSPYQYTPGPNCSKSAYAIGALFGKQLKGEDAIYAEGALKGEPRKIGIFYTNTPTATQCAQEIEQSLASYGVQTAASAALTFDLSDLPSESATAIATMKKAGVTTIICSSCDPVSPDYYFAAADSADYHPEWFLQSVFASGATNDEKFIRLFPGHQSSQIITIGAAPQLASQEEAVRAYNLGNTDPNAKIIPLYGFVYGSIIQFFDALQLAGPNLNPQNFQAAMSAIPKSLPGGSLGGWSGAAGPYDPASSFQILKWNPTGRSVTDGKVGTYNVCNGGQVYPFASDITSMPSEEQLECAPVVPTTTTTTTSTTSGTSGTSSSSTSSTASTSTTSGSKGPGAS